MATWYINADSGDDGTGDGSSGNPWETLAHAFDQSGAGDTIVCQDATAAYDWTNDTFDHDITIQGEQDDASGAIFESAGGASEIWGLSGADVTVENITFQNIENNGSGSGYEIPMFRLLATPTYLTVNNCKFKNIGISMGSDYGGIATIYNSQGFVTMNNVAFSNIYRATISASAPYLFGTRSPSANSEINLTGVSFSTVDNVNVLAGIFSHNDVFSINITVKNSIFRDANSNMDFGDNANVQSVTYSCHNNITNPPAGTGNITSDPLYVDEANDDLRLRPASPCIGTGTLT